MSALHAWRTELDRATAACPWPGARPLDRAQDRADRLLAGRDQEIRTFARLVHNNDVVVLTGRTGAGKSSLLSTGLVPALQQRDFEVIMCNFSKLSRAVAGRSAADLVSGLAERLPEGITRGEDAGPIETQLDRDYANTAVIVLDQFEELIRYQPDMYPVVLDWIHDTASRTDVRLVISLRIEFEHQLHGHGGLNLGPFQQARLELPPVFAPDDVRSVIKNPRVRPEHITEEAVEALIRLWEISGAVRGRGDIGLLHMQATLCVLWSRAEGRTVEKTTVAKLVDDVAPGLSEALDRDPSDPVPPTVRDGCAATFRYALAEYVHDRLELCRSACAATGVGLEHILTERASELVVAVSRHLSSGGYKVPQAVGDLAELVLFDEGGLASLREGAATAAAETGLLELARAFAATERHDDEAVAGDDDDWLGRSRAELMGETSTPDGWPWVLDPLAVTGGPLLGLRATDSVVEERRAFYFALEWLRSCSLISTVSIEADRTMVQLVHDGFDNGLQLWRAGRTARATAAIDRVTAVHGAVLDWRELPMEGVNHKIHANLRWTSCDVRANLHDVVFVNCDFSRTSFRDCDLSGVVFVNCVLDDVEFTDCRIYGRPNAAPDDLPSKQLKDQPSFDVDGVPEESLRSIARYRGVVEPGVAATLFSGTAGLPALPAAPRDIADPELVPFSRDAPRTARQPGGLTMFGSRLSSLKFARCDFGADGWLALRHVAGTSVEIAEQTNARIEVFAAALRGLTLTTPIDASDAIDAIDAPEASEASEASEAEAPAFELAITESQIINTWFGRGVEGTVLIRSSRVWQLFNASDRLTVTVEDSETFGAVNVGRQPAPKRALPAEHRPPTEESLGTMAKDVDAAGLKIDYRTHPARFEVKRDGPGPA